MTIAVAAFYEFAPLSDLSRLRTAIRALFMDHGVRGICLIAPEGINGTLAGPPDGLAATLDAMRALTGLALPAKMSAAPEIPFKRLKVRLKKEIVTLGVPSADPTRRVGTYVAPEDWNALIGQEDVLLIDTRNHFEVEMGSFQGTLDPNIASFGQFPTFVREKLDPAKHRRIAMFCTGGIRCEKASAFMLNEGFAEVYHLRGGILKYLEDVPEAESRWQGGCFVFDERVALGHGLKVVGGPSEAQP
ncbi:MAG: rhodanese-related sulfurtransferase [Proteobacteria bacterium]|nr:rhodanese-related sulfurtransferase [Pseudomonadota bacterium]